MSGRAGISDIRMLAMVAAMEADRLAPVTEVLQKAKEDEAERLERRAAQREREEYRVIVNGPVVSPTKTYKPNGTREQERRRRQRERREAKAGATP